RKLPPRIGIVSKAPREGPVTTAPHDSPSNHGVQRESSPVRKEPSRSNPSMAQPPFMGTAMVPLEEPFIEGQRFRQIDVMEVGNRLDLYRLDDHGPCMRLHGVLILVGDRADGEWEA